MSVKPTRAIPVSSASIRWLLALVGFGLLAVGCRDVTGPEPRGSIEAGITTTGEDIDPDGYDVAVDDSLSRHVGVNASATFPDLAVGDHRVRVSSMIDNCSLQGDNPRTVTVVDGDTVAVTMEINCVRRVGDLEASVTTSGEDGDPDGYAVTVDGESSESVASDGSVVFENLVEGDHEAELSGVADNCSVDGENPRTVTVPFAEVASVSFQVSCEDRVGSLGIAVQTTGDDLDPDGYLVRVDGGSAIAISIDGAVTIDGLSEGDHQVSLSGVADNCSVEGSNPRTVTVPYAGSVTTTYRVTCVGPLPTGGKIAFFSDRDGNFDIYLMNPDGSGVVQLTDVGTNKKPHLSPDRSRVVFRSVRGGVHDLWVVDSNGSNERKVASLSGQEWGPSWSPDGSKIVFARGSPGSRDIWVIGLDGSGLTRLTDTPADDRDPDWSPDGSKIAFTTDRDGHEEIYVMDADGSNPVNLSSNAEGNQRDSRPEWSPNGNKIVWDTNRDGASAQIYVMNPDGSDQTRVLTSSYTDYDPSWSPDGAGIVFTRNALGNKEVFVMRSDGTNVTQITDSGAIDNESTSWR